MLQTTLAVMIKGNKIFLGEKMRGFAKGVLNGVGGKQEGTESMDECMIREANEEIGINITKQENIGSMKFYFEQKPEWNLVVHLYNILEFNGTVIESDEIRPFWFDLDNIPYDKMWEFDSVWLPRILNGEKNVEYDVWYDTDNGKLINYKKLK